MLSVVGVGRGTGGAIWWIRANVLGILLVLVLVLALALVLCGPHFAAEW